ncbi:MAG: hypothetical protein IKS34_04750, partial [Clostridia bacterium]|nr:hypothetical protein [Clostridia bacterium]
CTLFFSFLSSFTFSFVKRISGRCLHSNGFRTGMQATLCCENSADEIEFGRFPTRKRMKTQPAVEKPFFQPAVEKRKAVKKSKPFWLQSFRAIAMGKHSAVYS